MLEILEKSLNNILIILISIILGLLLFAFSFVFLYFNEFVGKEILVGSKYIGEEKTIENSAKIITLESKRVFLREGGYNYKVVTWIFRGIGFFIMFFGLTLLLITIKGKKNIYGFFALFLSLLFSFLTIFFTNFISLIQSGKFNFGDFFSDIFGEKVENFFGNIFSNIFGLKSGFDIYFIFGILFLIFLFIYIFYSFINLFRKPKKSIFEKYEKK